MSTQCHVYDTMEGKTVSYVAPLTLSNKVSVVHVQHTIQETETLMPTLMAAVEVPIGRGVSHAGKLSHACMLKG